MIRFATAPIEHVADVLEATTRRFGIAGLAVEGIAPSASCFCSGACVKNLGLFEGSPSKDRLELMGGLPIVGRDRRAGLTQAVARCSVGDRPDRIACRTIGQSLSEKTAYPTSSQGTRRRLWGQRQWSLRGSAGSAVVATRACDCGSSVASGEVSRRWHAAYRAAPRRSRADPCRAAGPKPISPWSQSGRL
jgi:hypothetical protein